MSTSAAGGGPGPGPRGTFKSVQAPVKAPTVVLAVAAGVAGVYTFWELRVRASRKLGHIPRTIERDWQEAEQQRMQHAPFEANPNKFAFLNPFRHDVPHSRAICTK